MAIPDFQTLMLPFLKLCADGQEHHIQKIIKKLSDEFNLTEEERKRLLPSGNQPVINNRVGWARTYLKKAGLLESYRIGYLKITQRGLDVLKQNPPKIDNNFLKQFPEFLEFKGIKKDKANGEVDKDNYVTQRTPEELMEEGHQQVRESLSKELIKQIKDSSPAFFEKLVVELLVKMGYGGSRKDAGEAIGKSGDEGIDGIIKEDRLGLDIIYIQAKRWENNVGRDEIQKFVGALQGKRAKKGVFITTSDFTSNALDYIKQIDMNVILIDGEQLAQYMIDFDVGVSKVSSYDIKKIDSDYFVDE